MEKKKQTHKMYIKTTTKTYETAIAQPSHPK